MRFFKGRVFRVDKATKLGDHESLIPNRGNGELQRHFYENISRLKWLFFVIITEQTFWICFSFTLVNFHFWWYFSKHIFYFRIFGRLSTIVASRARKESVEKILELRITLGTHITLDLTEVFISRFKGLHNLGIQIIFILTRILNGNQHLGTKK